ncbi:hypothetical protein E3N88_16012 [Mikania micrantha]|uniref:Uncharacterized protein n=1 Tax=Mikania micrantha TaxID=192012 RepID=A0A5N6NXN1_9ASTR|nr:hypothetical protein E3N88_16012 [Mikania micrantha]
MMLLSNTMRGESLVVSKLSEDVFKSGCLGTVASVIAVILLLTAARLNNKQGGEVDSYGYIIICYVVKPGIFAAGAILAFLSTVLGIAGYVTSTPPSQTNTSPVVAIPMGANVDPEKNPMPFPPQQYQPQQCPPQ